MARLFKYFVWLVAGFVALFAIAAVALYLFFDPNDFREEISVAVKEKTGRDLSIEGDITLDLFPWLAVEVGKVSLGDAPGFGDDPIASFESAKLGVRLLPLILQQKVVVGAADIDSLQVNLKIDGSGQSNWSSLIPDDAEADAEADSDATMDVSINGFDISNARVSYTNAESGEVYLLDRMNLRIGRLQDDGSPVPLVGDLHFDMQPGNLSGDIELDTVLAFDAVKGMLSLDGVSVEGAIEGVAATQTTMNLTTSAVEVAMNEYQVSMQPMDLTVLGVHMTIDVQPFSYENRITPTAAIAIDAFSPRSMMTLFDVEPPLTADPVALSRVIVDANAQLTNAAIDLSDVTIKLDDTTFTGNLSVPRSPTGAYEFDLNGDTIDLNRYMEPTDGEAGAGEGSPTEIPADLIKPLNARGSLKMATATLGDIEFKNADLGLTTNNGRLRLFPVSAELFGGSYNGDVRVDVSGATPALSFNEKISGVDLASLAKAMFDQENISGTIDGAFVLSGSGDDLAIMQRSLKGTMSFELKDGSYEGTDIWYELRKARAKLKGEEPPVPELPARTRFSSVKATGVVTDGVLRNDDLLALLPYMQITGSGTVDLAAATVNYGLTARVLERPELLQGATAEELDEFTEAVIPMKITGPLASPSVRPDVEKLLRQRVEDEIKDKLKDKLKDLFKR